MRIPSGAAPSCRLLCLVLAYALLSPPAAFAAYAARTAAARTKRNAAAPRPTSGAQQGEPPAAHLPDLDEIRQLQPAEPEAPPPVPSTLCSPSNPNCPTTKISDPSPFADEDGPRTVSTSKPEARMPAAGPGGLPAFGSLFDVGGVALWQFALAMLDQAAQRGGGERHPPVGIEPAAAAATSLAAQGAPPTNLAAGKTATQSSTGWGGNAARAVDGNTSGDYLENSVTHTGSDAQARWEVDLGGLYSLQTVEVWNRADCCSDRLADFYVLVSDSAIPPALADALGDSRVSSYHTTGQGGRPTSVAVGRTGRYVRVQLAGTNYLSLAEVEVWGSGPVRRSLSVSGAGLFRVPHAAGLDPGGPFTLEAWVKPSATAGVQHIVSRHTPSGEYYLIANGGMPQLYVVNGAGQSDHAIQWPPAVTAGRWHHVAGVFDGAQLRVYLDGVLRAAKNTTVAPGSGTGGLTLGGFHTGDWAMFSGLVDEVRLTAGALYTSDFTPQARLSAVAGTRGLWKFDGQTGEDSSGNGNHGALWGDASYSADAPANNLPPAVGLTAPADGAAFPNDSNLNITAEASDADGAVMKVEFFQNATKLGEDTTAPYEYVWAHAPSGSHTLTAKATDDAGASVTSAAAGVTITPPSVSVTASDADASEQGPDAAAFNISRTGGTSQPLTVSFTVSGTATNGGDYATLSDVVTIPAGSASQAVTVTPTDDAAVEGSETVTLTLSVNAAYAVGSPSVATVQISDNDALPTVMVAASDALAAEPGADTGAFTVSRTGPTASALTVGFTTGGTAGSGVDYAPLGASVNIPAGAGSAVVTVMAADDASVEGDETVILTLSPGGGYTVGMPAQATIAVRDDDTHPPAVSITAPATGAVLHAPAAVHIGASASDVDGTVGKVEFYQGTVKLGEDTSAPFGFDWVNVSAGTYTLTARATDNMGGTAVSSAVALIVNGPPSAALTSPASGAAVAAGSDLTVKADAADAEGAVTKVEFFNGDFKLGEDASAPYSYTWANVPAGSHALTTRATDNHGATTVSAVVSVSAADFTAARLDPINRTGSTDLFSRNYHWGVTLVSLPGRAGLDLSLSLSYNSLVWLKSGSSMLFDPDRGFPTPGFRFGFPVVQGPLRNTSAGANVYVLVTPDGSRVELRQTAAPNVFEAADSSYLRLEVDAAGLLYLRPADGSLLTYRRVGGEYQCVEIKDRHGNYVTAEYTPFGRLDKVTDTLGRVVKVNYDPHQNPLSITQQWTVDGQQQTHTWATFGYDSRAVDISFPGLSVAGAVANRQIPILSQVGLDDGTRYKFDYNARGQIERITHSAQDEGGHWVDLSYVAHTLPANDTDCPRFTERREWARDWNTVGEAAEPVATAFSTEGDWQVVATPNGTLEKVRYEMSGWKLGLVTATESWATENAQSVRKRWTATVWVQDDESLIHAQNPRALETTVSDTEGNSRRTAVEYLTAAESAFRLPKKVSVYNGTDDTPLRYTETVYEPASVTAGSAYTNRRIIGLVKEQLVKEGDGTLRSRVELLYDEAGCVESFEGGAAATRHDASYAAPGARGLVCRARRHNVGVIDADNPPYVDEKMTYNPAGAAVSVADPENHKHLISYRDNFADSLNRNTFAYPTATTDPDQSVLPEAERKRTTNTYDFHTGLVARTRDPKGAEHVLAYDGARRLSRRTRRDGVNSQDNGYTRWVYAPAHGHVQTYTLIERGVEAYEARILDGAGRTRAEASLLPGSTGGYSGRYLVYDKLGRLVKQSNPVEMTPGWVAAGDDATPAGTGWIYQTQDYDWKGRPTTLTHADGTTRETKYGGCGCAGGEVVTTRDEVGRRQKMVYDILGRPWKTHVLFEEPKTAPLDDGGAVYSTTVNTYNALDQLTRVKQYKGSDTGGGTFQETVMTYDGHGRLSERKRPEQVAPTAYLYNADDQVRSIKDARGFSSAYTYNNRHLVKTISYAARTGSALPGYTEYEYDAVGNRTLMTDGSGGTTYQYNTLSLLQSETRRFDGLTGTYTAAYEYNMAGEVKSVADPFGAKTTYEYDGSGRLLEVNGSGFSDLTRYASGIRYRAWGAVRGFAYGANSQHRVAYNYTPGLQASRYEVTFTIVNSSTHGMDFEYYDDGRLKSSHDIGGNPQQDRSYTYDHAGRVTRVLSGAESRGGAVTDRNGIPFRQDYGYDENGHTTSSSGWHWTKALPTASQTYVNNRNQSFVYDDDGRTIVENKRRYTYDSAGRLATTTEQARNSARVALTLHETYDGDGFRTKRTENGKVTYEMRSSVLRGKLLDEIDPQGRKVTGYVYAGGQLLAEQHQSQQIVKWVTASPDGSGEWWTHRFTSNDSFQRGLSLDAHGRDVGVDNPYLSFDGNGLGSYPAYGDPSDLVSGCAIDNSIVRCEVVGKVVSRNRVAVIAMLTGGWLGMATPERALREVHAGDDSILIGTEDTPDGFKMWVTAPPPSLVAATVGYNMLWLAVLPTTTLVEQVATAQRPVQNPNKAQELDVNTFIGCLRTLFNTEMKNADSRVGSMYFEGYSKNARTWYQRLFNTGGDFVVHTSTDLNSSQLAVKIGGLFGTPNPVVGATDGSRPHNNWVSSNIIGSNPAYFQSIWVYELGNALGYITGLKPEIRDPDRYGVLSEDDVGGALVDCVYGGRVTDRGTLERPR